ncbi:unnamed protein product [Polarella glacialis]|uniref:NFACT RNA-binding domain-containing protein n=1 Tax=Polarella glacialis TaxID=89957 RepID=A0A813K0Y3_POLGL|nr:unnamed protein product [Polarella glacialis]CAE8692038.1 unnamed protein product [Polarella glacialis]
MMISQRMGLAVFSHWRFSGVCAALRCAETTPFRLLGFRFGARYARCLHATGSSFAAAGCGRGQVAANDNKGLVDGPARPAAVRSVKGSGDLPTQKAPCFKVPAPPKGCRSVTVPGQDGTLWQVLMGKTAVDNDRLSLEIGQPQEVWMHVAGLPGSHAVVRSVPGSTRAPALLRGGSDRPPRDVLKVAAGVCAFYSKAKAQLSVEVHVTTCSKVGKMPGSPAGQVLLAGKWESIKVKPLDPQSLKASSSSDR